MGFGVIKHSVKLFIVCLIIECIIASIYLFWVVGLVHGLDGVLLHWQWLLSGGMIKVIHALMIMMLLCFSITCLEKVIFNRKF